MHVRIQAMIWRYNEWKDFLLYSRI